MPFIDLFGPSLILEEVLYFQKNYVWEKFLGTQLIAELELFDIFFYSFAVYFEKLHNVQGLASLFSS